MGERLGLGDFRGGWGLVLFFPRWIKGLNRGGCRRRGAWRFSTVLQPRPDTGDGHPWGWPCSCQEGSSSLGITSSHGQNPRTVSRATAAAMGLANRGKWAKTGLSIMSIISLKTRI